MKIHLHQTHHTIGDFEGIFATLKETLDQKEAPGLHLFPELFLTGYPLQDLCLQRTFVQKYLDLLAHIDTWSSSLEERPDCAFLLGGLSYSFDEADLPYRIENVIFELIPGRTLKKIYTKQLLPSYDIFDEGKYFSSGKENTVWRFQDKNFALLVCEDMWPSSLYAQDPARGLEEIVQGGTHLDAVINLSASPFHLGKQERRLARAKEISSALGAPFFYINRVGGEDEILFDGATFAVNGERTLYQLGRFKKESMQVDLPSFEGKPQAFAKQTESTWESLFQARLTDEHPPKLSPLSDDDCALILQALGFGLQEYARKTGHKKFTVALSGGIDSALVLTLIRLSLEEGQELEAIFMPGLFTTTQSHELSEALCKNLGVPLFREPIKLLHSMIRNTHRESFGTPLEGLADENIQARLRGSLLFARSNEKSSLVINTSNKSEISVGYSTIYGDSVGALSLLGDLYKSEVFQLAEFINKRFDGLIPEEIITRPPSAELRENQEDAQSLPPYERLDAALEGFLSYRLTLEELTELGLPREEVEKAYRLYSISEYKRKQFCPIIKLKAKSFGFGHRIPICKKM